MNKKKIALVNVFFPPQSLGGATRVLSDNIDILRHSWHEQYELVGFTTDHGDQPPHSIEVYLHAGMRVYRAGVVWRKNMDWHPRDEKMGELFGRFLEFERPDLVHFHCVQRLSGSVVEAARRAGIPYLITAHDAWWISDFQFLTDPSGRVYQEGHPQDEVPEMLPDGVTAEQSSERRSFLKSLLADAKAVLPVSEAFAKIYRRNGVAHAKANRNGVPPNNWKPRVPSQSGRVRVGHIGGMSAHKGYDLFREALSGSGLQNLEAVVVDLSKPFGYKREANWDGFPVTFIGKVPQTLTAQLYSSIDVLAAPSLWPESFGLVTREAAAAGVWVVASDAGAIGEDVVPGITGDIVKAGSLQSLTQVLERINKHPRQYLVQLEPARFPGVETQVERLSRIYEEVV